MTRSLTRIVLFAAAVYAGFAGTAAAQAVRGTLLGNVDRHAGCGRPGRERDGHRDADEHRPNDGHQPERPLRLRQHEGRPLPRRDRAHRVQEVLARRCRGEGQLDRPRRRDARGRQHGGDGRGRTADPLAADGPRRHGEDDRGPAGVRAAPRLQPQLPGPVGDRAGHRDADPSPLAVLQPAGQPGDEGQRPVAPGEQRPDRRRRRQREDRPAAGVHPVRRLHRLRDRQHLELRRRVRQGGRLGDHGRPEVRHQPVEGQRLRVRNTEADAGEELLRVGDLPEGADQVRAVRSHARRTHHPGQAVLLRRLPVHEGQPRQHAAPRRAPARMADRQLPRPLPRPSTTPPRATRTGPAAPVPGQHHPPEPDQPRRPQHPGPDDRPQHPGCGAGAGQLRMGGHAREDDERRQRQAELQPDEQRPAARSGSATSGRRSWIPPPTAGTGGLRRPPTTASRAAATRTPTAPPSPGRGRSARA